LRMAISTYRLDLQCRHYLDSYAALFQFARQGVVHGTCPLPASWPKRLVDPSDVKWVWVFHATDAPVSKGREMGQHSPLLNMAARQLAAAKNTYRECITRFGSGPWIDDEPIRAMADADLAPWLLEDVEV